MEGWHRVLELLLKPNQKIVEFDNCKVVYNLIFKNALYSFECYKEGTNKNDLTNYCYIENFTEDEGEAETFLISMVKGKVFPVHIKDMIEDYFLS